MKQQHCRSKAEVVTARAAPSYARIGLTFVIPFLMLSWIGAHYFFDFFYFNRIARNGGGPRIGPLSN